MPTIIYDDAEVLAALSRLQHKVGNLRPALLDIGEALTKSTQMRFETSLDPDGNAWRPNSPVTLQHKQGNRPLIGETGELARQIHPDVVDDHTLEVVSSMEYAAMMQFGGTKAEFPHLWGDIPARPFLGVSMEDKAEILAIIDEHLRQAM